MRVLGVIALLKMVDCLFRSHLLDAVVDGQEEYLLFLSRHEHVIGLVLLLFDVTKLVFEWM